MTTESVLAIGAHPDDIELGCGGTLARHRAAGGTVTMLVMTDGQSGPGEVGGRRAEARRAAEILEAEVIFGGLQDGMVHTDSHTVAIIEEVLDQVKPWSVYTHAEDDSHQDHRNVAAAVLSAARNYSTVLHYQSPSTRTFDPQAFIALDQAALDIKLEALAQHASQVESSLRVDINAVSAGAQYWGSRARTPMAEAFVVTRALLNPTRQGLVIGERRSSDSDWQGPDRRA